MGSTVLAVLGALGGASAFVTIITVTLRAIFRQVNATEKNTSATENLTKAVESLHGKFEQLDRRVMILEDHDKGHRNGVRHGV